MHGYIRAAVKLLWFPTETSMNMRAGSDSGPGQFTWQVASDARFSYVSKLSWMHVKSDIHHRIAARRSLPSRQKGGKIRRCNTDRLSEARVRRRGEEVGPRPVGCASCSQRRNNNPFNQLARRENEAIDGTETTPPRCAAQPKKTTEHGY